MKHIMIHIISIMFMVVVLLLIHTLSLKAYSMIFAMVPFMLGLYADSNILENSKLSNKIKEFILTETVFVVIILLLLYMILSSNDIIQ